MLPIRTILHPTDFSEASTCALQVACSLAQDYGTRLILLYVDAPPMAFYSEYSVPPDPGVYREAARARLMALQLPFANLRAERRLEEGDPATQILRVAQQTQTDLIVMGTHGRTGLGRLLIGSVAEHVVRRAPCPVLTVRAPFPQAAPVREAPLAAAMEA